MTKLPAASRLQAIADLLRAGEGIGIAAMAERFSVTMETIRRDLVILEKDGLLTRVHGGAIPVSRAAPLSSRLASLSAEKAVIGKLAAQTVARDGWIFITHGSTALAVAKALNDGPAVSVMTNMPAIAEVLQSGIKHRVTVTGGEYDYANGALMGEQVLEAISECIFDTAVIAAYGVDPVHGLVESSKYLQRFKRLLFERSRRRIFVADHSKFGASGAYVSVSLSDIGTIVTDEPPPAAFADGFKDAGVRVVYPQNNETNNTEETTNGQ
ncbi:DeoR/GlpR transcriptional regulator [Mesorhizobium sp. WSM4307]|uniref:DeoR/GlpR family DNA-binding transcription regulator n=1 Tax=unclassified Mesorhizobium TaxID=325217 RepID=UPI000BAFA5D8|nr:MULTISPECIES: DeoR/GlpR family DNA-binding transcription regulator [unclassified Mesorhizobium]PBB24546.1 DeoR family transcriptional regulator [Mesorhizobium sp. WSM4304]PBB74779.1 DeoR family transcriptional regulator [Mesorhizobium sp. WSM4308]TRC73248.1 DeoR/GlpR transcriptional regulator [Mesorhizobium sp. WSM4315]TRC83527.1 DeoR/GlpR transcriptional regulator [Mesorhizobium sp. WSM4307]